MNNDRYDWTRRDFLRNSTAAGMAITGLSGLPAWAAPTTRPAEPKLPYGTFGRTGYPATLISFGAILISDRTGMRVLKAGIDRGINLLHTCAGYTGGKSIEMIGELFKAAPEYRDKVFLCLKSYHPEREDEIDNMLKTLHVDHADITMTTFHKPEPKRLDAIRNMQDKLKKKGKIRHSGFVCHGDMNDVLELVIQEAPDYFDGALLSTAMLPKADEGDGNVQDEVKRFKRSLKILRGKGTGILSMKSGARTASKEAGQVFQAHAKTILEAGADSVLTSIDSFTQVEMVAQLDLKSRVPDETEHKTAAALQRRRGRTCMMCGRCTGACPEHLPVSDLMRVRLYQDEYGWAEHARSEFAALGLSADQFAACGNCSACSGACPMALAGPETVTRIARQFV